MLSGDKCIGDMPTWPPSKYAFVCHSERIEYCSVCHVMVLVVGAVVRGVAEINNKLFVVFDQSFTIDVYDALTFNELTVIPIQRMRKPRDIVACRLDNQLYVADEHYHIWRRSCDDY